MFWSYFAFNYENLILRSISVDLYMKFMLTLFVSLNLTGLLSRNSKQKDLITFADPVTGYICGFLYKILCHVRVIDR